MSSKHYRRDSSCLCVVCCEDVEFYAIGQCDHPVCYKCCVRMRVLARENYCSVCRSDLDMVLLTADHAPWKSLKSNAVKSDLDKKYGICYATKEMRDKVKILLQHRCGICPDAKPFHTFEKLEAHMKKTHHLYYCSLCVKHYTKFSHERSTYTRQELARHRRVGDTDDKSHKGHPLCEFCDERFLDNDELHQHLRKNHFWCHFCERDGKQLYYDDYPNLRAHFLHGHFVCEEDQCRFEQFTSVFRTEIDLQAHRAAQHVKKLTKAQAKQARQVEIDITYNRSPVQGRSITRRDYAEIQSNDRKQQRDGRPRPRVQASSSSVQEEQALKTANKASLTAPGAKKPSSLLETPNEPSAASSLQTACQAVESVQSSPHHFPSLPSTLGNPPNTRCDESTCKDLVHVDTRSYKATVSGIQSDKDFPSLGGGTIPEKAKKERGKDPPKRATMMCKTSSLEIHSVEDFPTLGGTMKATPSTGPPPGFLTVAKKPPPGLNPSQVKSADQSYRPPFNVQEPTDNVNKPLSVTGLDLGQQSIRHSTTPSASSVSKVELSSKTVVNSDEDLKHADTQNRQERNQALIESIRALLGYDKEKFKEFKTLSGTFRQGLCTGEDYYAECMRLFDQNFMQVFTELVDLLPDSGKQQELLRVHNDAKARAKQQATKLTKGTKVKTVNAWGAQLDVADKETSKPVKDSRQSAVSRESDFPSLPAPSNPTRAVPSVLYRANNTTLKSAWVRGK